MYSPGHFIAPNNQTRHVADDENQDDSPTDPGHVEISGPPGNGNA